MNINDYRPPLLAILRGLTTAEAPAVAAALFDAGLRLLEVPLNRPQALDCIALLDRIKPADALVGGGTICNVDQVDQVFQAGGRLMVAPNFEPVVVARARQHGMLAMPGVATPTEALAALGAGADAVKWFPAEALGFAGLKSVKAVLPAGAQVWPVGGIGIDQLADWIGAGAGGVGIGGQLYRPGMAVAELAGRARALVAAWQALPGPKG
jgi:2-dehydro-3-deoxyphosphogalactonate aldolase